MDPYRLIVVPYWFPASVCTLAPLVWAVGTKRQTGVLDLMIIVATVAPGLALPAILARSMNQSAADSG